MKKFLPVLLLVIILIFAGCINGNKTNPVTPSPTLSQPLTDTLTTTAPTTVLSTPTQTYKNADLVLTLNTQPAYGFKMDYPSEWTYKKEHTKGWSAGYNFSSPDEKSYVFVGFDNAAGAGNYYYPLYVITENAVEGKSWESNIIKGMTDTAYCNDGRNIPVGCGSSQPSSSYYYMRLISNDTVIMSGNIKARKIVFAPDIKDPSMDWWYTDYIMHVGPMQGYNFTVPGHFEVAKQVSGDVWDYGMGGLAYSISITTPTKKDMESPIYDHMIKSFEVTGID